MIHRERCSEILSKASGGRWDHWSNEAKRTIALDAMQLVIEELLAMQALEQNEIREYLRLRQKYEAQMDLERLGHREQPTIDRSDTPEVLRAAAAKEQT